MPLLRFESLQLHEVGPFADLQIDFPPMASANASAEIHLLTGPNGCGKSTLLYCLAEAFSPTGTVLGSIRSRFRAADSRVNFKIAGAAGAYGLYCEEPPPLQNAYGPYSLVTYEPADRQFSGLDSTGSDGQTLLKYRQNLHAYEDSSARQLIKSPFGAFAYSGQRSIQRASLGNIQPIQISPFESSLSFETSVRPKLLVQWIANNRTQWALAQTEGDEAGVRDQELALERITNFIKQVCDLDFEFKLARSPLEVTVAVGGRITPLECLSDGLKSILSWLGDLSLRLDCLTWEKPGDVFAQPIFLFLDEIDIHLHPKWQRLILPAVQKLLPNAQVFVSTHSPFVVGSISDAWVYRLPEAGGSFAGKIEGIPSGAGKSYAAILNEVFQVTEDFDPETEELIAGFYQARDSALNGGPVGALEVLGSQLAERGEESRAIVHRELRQISRRLGKQVCID